MTDVEAKEKRRYVRCTVHQPCTATIDSQEFSCAGIDLPVFIGGRLNQIPEASNTSLPVDVGDELAAAGAVVCRSVGDMLARLSDMARESGETPPP